VGDFVCARGLAGLVRGMRYDPDTFGDAAGWSNEPSDEQKQDFYRSVGTCDADIIGENEMGFIATDSGGGDFKKVPPGAWIGRCYSLIDMGTQMTHGQYGDKEQHKIRISWELFGDDEDGKPLTIDIDGEAMPMTISKQYTLSLGEKANLRRDLASWRGKAFTEEEVRAFDISALLGKYCMVNVAHNDTNGKVYANVMGLTPIPSALRKSLPDAVHADQIFNLDKPDLELFETFYEKLQDAIKSSPEWAEFAGSQRNQNANNTAKPSANFDDMDDDIPF
jgi:hypothetical protein